MEYELKIEKPLAYLDQNILDLFVKGNTCLMDELSSKFHVVYSDETLKEIKRSGENAFKFIEVLKKLEAYHINSHAETPRPKTQSKVIVKKEIYQPCRDTHTKNSEQGHSKKENL